MIDKSKYKKLKKHVQERLMEQAGSSFIAVDKSFLYHSLRGVINGREIDEAWKYIVKDLGLVDDGTGTNTWTLPGRGFTVESFTAAVILGRRK